MLLGQYASQKSFQSLLHQLYLQTEDKDTQVVLSVQSLQYQQVLK